MLKAGVDKVYRDKILGQALQGMDKHYMVVEDEDLKRAMGIFTDYLDKKTIELANVDQKLIFLSYCWRKGKARFPGRRKRAFEESRRGSFLGLAFGQCPGCLPVAEKF